MSLFTSLNVRLPAATVGLALLSAAAMGGLSWYAARAGLTEAAQERLQFAATARKTAIELVADRAKGDLMTAAGNPQVASNFTDLTEAFDPAKPDYAGLVQSFTSPPTAEARMAVEGGGTMYGRRHAKV